jgi:hypothetical protein
VVIPVQGEEAMRRWESLVLALALLLAACVPGGVRTESGWVDLGSGVFEDEPVGHNLYPSFAEFAVATHEFDDMAKDGYSREQQICFAKAFMNQVPQNIHTELDQFARGEKTLLESEYSALRRKLDRYITDENVALSAMSEFKANCA